ncbi:response regulator [Candidatus Saccharibacteria bacterium]|nr:response regulator [Candidatus Saccharibacteria bacterium]
MSAKILLVEDDELMARMYQRFLAHGDFIVELAADGQEGYEKAKVFKPDLILLDIMMPRLNGLQALDKLKQDPETKDFIVVMLTNLADKEDAELAISKGAARYLIKSDYDMEDITGVINEILSELKNNKTI